MSYLSETNIRSTLALIGFLATLFAAWWVPLIIMTLLALRYRAWEVLLLGLLIDLLWLPSLGLFSPLPLCTLFSIATVWIFEPLRNQFLRP